MAFTYNLPNSPRRVLFSSNVISNLERYVSSFLNTAVIAGLAALYACGGGSPSRPSDPNAFNIISHKPASTLPKETTETVFGPTTNRDARCRYNPNKDVPYNEMMLILTETPARVHETTLTGLQSGRYQYFVGCETPEGKLVQGYSIAFEVLSENPQPTVYNAKVKVVDAVTRNPVNGATVDFDGKTGTSGGDGVAVVNNIPVSAGGTIDAKITGNGAKPTIASYSFGPEPGTYELGEIAVPTKVDKTDVDMIAFKLLNTRNSGIYNAGIQNGTVNWCGNMPKIVVHADTYNSLDQELMFPVFTENASKFFPRYVSGNEMPGNDFTRKPGPVPSSDNDRLKNGEFLVWEGTAQDTGDPRFQGKVVISINSSNCITSAYYVHLTGGSRSAHNQEFANVGGLTDIDSRDVSELGGPGPQGVTNLNNYSFEASSHDYAAIKLSNGLYRFLGRNGVTVTKIGNDYFLDYRTLGVRTGTAINGIQRTTSSSTYQGQLPNGQTTTQHGFSFRGPGTTIKMPGSLEQGVEREIKTIKQQEMREQ